LQLVSTFTCAAILACSLSAQAPPKLQYVVIITRHGVRSPTWTNDRLNEYSTAPWPDWGVGPGYLTPGGFERMKLMGRYYRHYLAGEQLLDPGTCADAQHLYFRADSDQCAVETAKALAQGLVPNCPVPIDARPEGTTRCSIR
jgi:4-phytase/acid phosphatase